LAQKRSGYAGENPAPASFTEDAAAKTGLSQRTVQQSIRRTTRIDEKVRDKVRAMPEIANSRVELDALGDLDPQRQRHAIGLVESGKARDVRDAKRQMTKPLSKEAQIRALREGAPVIVRPVAADPPATDDVNALQALLLTLRGDPRRVTGIPLDKRVTMARTCLAWLNIKLDDLRAP